VFLLGNKNIDDFFKKSAYKNEPQELKNYINELNQGVDPNRKTFTDRIGEFFKSVTEKASRYYPLRSRKDIVRKHSRFRRKLTTFFGRAIKRVMDRFNFEAGVDILDDTSVLYRRNKVNRNILMVTNAVFIIFTVIGNQKPNYIIIIIFGIIMLAINTTLGRIINEQPRTLVKQQMAMYFGSVYILIASVGVYVKLQISAVSLKVSDIGASNQFFTEAAMQNEFLARALTSATDTSIAQAGYILIYFALVVVALYQDPTLLRILFKWVLVVMTGIHILVLHQLYNYPSLTELYNYLVKTNFNVSIDIILRTLVLIVFYIALYSSVSIGEMMNNKRKEEFVKRSEMEKDFKAVVGDVFDVIGVFNSHTIIQNTEDAHRVAEVASRLASVLGLSSHVCTEIYDYSVIHISNAKELSILEYESKEVLNEKDYQAIREKTILGSVIIKRLQLNQKSEDIVRAHFEKTADSSFTEKMKRVQRSQEGQIILLSEMYDVLRQPRNYKSAFQHKRATDLLSIEFKEYFEDYILDRFLKYQAEFETYYNQYKHVPQ